MNNKSERSKSGHSVISGTNLASGWLEWKTRKPSVKIVNMPSGIPNGYLQNTTHTVSKETMMLQCLLTNFTPVFDTPARTEKQIKKSMVHSIKGLVISVYTLTIHLLYKTS